jgi:type III secretory pathway component EscT
MDNFRGASAESILPGVGESEAASGDLLHQLLLAMATVNGVLPLLLHALWRSFGLIPLGRWGIGEGHALAAAGLVGNAMAVALTLGIPMAVATLLCDAALAFASRLGSTARLQELMVPLRLLLGAGLLYVGFAIVSDRLISELGQVPGGLLSWLQVRG